MTPRGDRAAVFVVRSGRILVLRREKRGRRYLAVPGGTLDPGETPAEAAVRELSEETGLAVTVGAPVLTLRNAGRTETYFDALSAVGEPELGGEERERNSPENRYELDWVGLDAPELRDVLPPGLASWMRARDWGETV